jgi:hypothetical protein
MYYDKIGSATKQNYLNKKRKNLSIYLNFLFKDLFNLLFFCLLLEKVKRLKVATTWLWLLLTVRLPLPPPRKKIILSILINKVLLQKHDILLVFLLNCKTYM